MDQEVLDALNSIEGATVTFKPEVKRGALASREHYRLEFKGWKTAVLVFVDPGGFFIYPARSTLKKLPKSIKRRGKKATLQELIHCVGLWRRRYLKAYPVIEVMPTARQVMDAALYGAPLKDKYYK